MKPHDVLMLAYPFPPAAYAGVFRTIRFVRYLPEFGWKPLVVTPAVASLYPQRLDRALEASIPADTIVARSAVLRPVLKAEKAFHALRSWPKGKQERQNVDCDDRTPLAEDAAGVPSPSALRRAMRAALDLVFSTPDNHMGWMLPALKAALALVRQHQPRAIYCTSPPHSANLIGVVLKAITGLPLVLDFRDPWARPEWGRQKSRTLRVRLQSRLEQFCVERSDRVILNTLQLRDDFRTAYPAVSEDRFLVIPNGYDPEMACRICELVARNGHPHISESIRVCHAGSVYGHRDLRPLVRAVGALAQSGHDVRLEQIGGTTHGPEIVEYVRRNHLEEHITLQGQLPHDQTLEHLAADDVLVVIQPGTSIQVPAKLFELLLFRKPILALTGQGATADIVKGFGLGVVADPDDSSAIAAAILDAANNRPECDDGGWNRAMEAFDGRRLTGELAQVLDGVV